MTPLCRRVAPLAQEILQELGASTDDIILGDPDNAGDWALGQLEHLVHELCHAVLMSVDVSGPDLGTRISSSISYDRRLREEANAWAVEWQIWSALGLPYEFASMVAHAEVQGVHKPLLLDALGEDWSDQAHAVLCHLVTLTEEMEDRRNDQR